jgi:hypothetical protein
MPLLRIAPEPNAAIFEGETKLGRKGLKTLGGAGKITATPNALGWSRAGFRVRCVSTVNVVRACCAETEAPPPPAFGRFPSPIALTLHGGGNGRRRRGSSPAERGGGEPPEGWWRGRPACGTIPTKGFMPTASAPLLPAAPPVVVVTPRSYDFDLAMAQSRSCRSSA